MDKIKKENLLLVVYACMAFTLGLWSDYSQLWLVDIGFDISTISKLLSISLLCSATIIFIISFFSTKVKLKNITLLSLVIRTISFICLMFIKNTFVIKASILACIMCENIFGLSFYPLLSTVNKSNRTYKKQVIINYIAKDSAIILCGFMIGKYIGLYLFDYGTCLVLSYIFNSIGMMCLIVFNKDTTKTKEKPNSFIKSFLSIFKDKTNNYYLFAQFIMEISYSLIYGLIIIVLTEYLGMSVAMASLCMIISNVLGAILNIILSKYSDNYSLNLSCILKYGIRLLFIIAAIIINKPITNIIAIVVLIVSSRILDDKVNGTFIRNIDDDARFLFGNIRYFILCIADSIALLLSGTLLVLGIKYAFIVTAIFIVFGMFVYMYFLGNKHKNNKSEIKIND